MPLVRVDMRKGKIPEYKKTVHDCIHEGLVEAIQIEDWDIFIVIHEPPFENWGMGGQQLKQKG